MCGIAGVIDPARAPQDAHDRVGRMCDAMWHRGPDDGGQVDYPGAALGMRRLAIFDPAHGHQPMQTPDRRLTVVFNGAIYNFRELRAELREHGYTFHTECDTEVLLAAFHHWDLACVARLRGMFAFAVWDASSRRLHLARDPFGIKPLYYIQEGPTLAFASEVRALHAAGLTSGEIDSVAAHEFLAWSAVPAPRTVFRGVHALLPGQSATFSKGTLTLQDTWNFPRATVAVPRGSSEGEFIYELRSRLEETTRAHLIADVPVGAFLSGGLDSAAVVALMTRLAPGRLRTFSVGFEEPAYSESGYAAETARHLGTEHHEFILTGAQVASDLPALLDAFDQPSGDGINTYYASQAARAGGVTVALSGVGGDELFGGYPSFRHVPRYVKLLRAWGVLPSAARRYIIGRLRRGDTRSQKLADLLEHARDLSDVSALHRRLFSTEACREILAAGAEVYSGTRSPFHPRRDALAAEVAGAAPASQISAWELRTYMTDVLLRDSDVMSMRHSLELRVPFVDRPLIEWLWGQPAAFRRNHAPKQALFDALRDLLPPGLQRRPKRGFTLPFAQWMRRELRPFLEETFSTASVSRTALFAPAAVQARWNGFLHGADSREWSRVWSLAMLIAFSNRKVPSRREGTNRISVATTGSLV